MAVDVTSLALTAVGSLGLGGVAVKLLSRNTDRADADMKRSAAHQSDVDSLRQIIAEVRESEARKATRIDALEIRLDKLEERERHALTRAAVHEAWDQLALQFIVAHSDQGFEFPPPPPLSS